MYHLDTMYTKWYEKHMNRIEKNMSCGRALNFDQWKHFPKTISQWNLIMACLQIHQELLSLATFLQVHSNSKEVSYLSWQNTDPNLKTTCHMKLKYFLWTTFLENLLLAKYLISVTVPLILLYIERLIKKLQ